MAKLHHYHATTKWVGNRGEGTLDYKGYDRNHDISIEGKQTLLCSSDPSFRGDKSRLNPEDLLVSSLSGCHMLWYLHLCVVNGVVITAYEDEASGVMQEDTDGSGYFLEVTLRPNVVVADKSMFDKAIALHHDANKMCFIANSVKFPVRHEPTVTIKNYRP
jgi:organic hydroperoxide reductase OsmC/OhrA